MKRNLREEMMAKLERFRKHLKTLAQLFPNFFPLISSKLCGSLVVTRSSL